MRIIVLGNGLRPGVPETVAELMPVLCSHCRVVLEDLLYRADLSAVAADLVLVFGGDGAILRAARQMGYRQRPVLGINLGRLGFLADLTPEEVRTALPDITGGNFLITRHLMYECVIEADGQPTQTFLGLNEIAVQTGPPFHLIDLDLFVDGKTAVRYSGNGLIVSTPIGSTGHSLSAGGPILGQELQAFVLTPICAHALTHRPLVDSADKVYSLVVRRATTGGAMLVIDGQLTLSLWEGHRVTVRRASVCFHRVRAAGHDYYRTLRDKLHWGNPPAYRGEP